MTTKREPPWNAKAIFFDAAGTLFQVRGSVGEIYGRCAAKFGFEGGEKEQTCSEIQQSFLKAFRAKAPMTFPGFAEDAIVPLERQWWEDLVERTFAPFDPLPRMDEFFDALYETFETAQAWQLEPGCQELLAGLRARGKRLGIISNFDSRLSRLLGDLGILHYFDDITISSRAPAAKPSQHIFDFALQKLGASSQESVHVGDHITHDYQGAQAAGLAALLYDPGEQHTSGFNGYRITSLTEVCSFLL